MEQNTKPYKRIVYKAFLFLYIRKKELFKAVWPWPIRCPGHCPEWIRKARQKTKNMCNIPLLEEARKILDRYKEHPYCQAHSVLLPVCSAIQATDKDNRYDTQSGTETDTPTKGCLRGHMELRHAPIEVIIAKVQSKDKAMTLSTIHRVLDSFCKAGICRWYAISKRANATTTSRCTNITTCSTEDESWFTTMRSWSA